MKGATKASLLIPWQRSECIEANVQFIEQVGFNNLEQMRLWKDM